MAVLQSQQPNAPTNPVQSAPAKPQQGTGFVNLQQFIRANQGNRLGQTIGSGIGNIAQGAKTGLQQSQQQFQQQTGQAQEQTRRDIDASQRALQQIAQNYGSQPQQSEQQGSIVQPASSEDISAFSRLGRGQYQGPQQLNVAQGTVSQVGEAQALGQLARQGNKTGLLQRFVGGPQYSLGQQRLDELLLGQTAAPQLAAASRAGAQIGSQLTQAQQQALLQAQQGQQQLQQGKAQVGAQLGSTTQAIDQTLAGRQAARIQEQQDLYNRIQQGLQSSGKMDSTGGIGVAKELYQTLGGPQSTAFLTQQDFLQALNPFQESAITKSGVATQEDLARTQALQQLAGALGTRYDSGLAADQLGNAGDKYAGIGLSSDQLKSRQLGQQQVYEAAAAPIQEQLKKWDETAKALYARSAPSGGSGFKENLEGARNNAVAMRNNLLQQLQNLQNQYSYGGFSGPVDYTSGQTITQADLDRAIASTTNPIIQGNR